MDSAPFIKILTRQPPVAVVETNVVVTTALVTNWGAPVTPVALVFVQEAVVTPVVTAKKIRPWRVPDVVVAETTAHASIANAMHWDAPAIRVVPVSVQETVAARVAASNGIGLTLN